MKKAEGTIISAISGYYDVEIDNKVVRTRARGVFRDRKQKPLVGDRVVVQLDDQGMNYLIEEGKEIWNQGDTSYMDIEIDPEEFKVLIFTSGTTSASKGVMVCNRNLTENVYACQCYVYLRPKDKLFSVLPLHHTYESTIGFLLPFTCGCSVAICEGLRYIVPNLQESKPTAMLAVPLLIESLYKKINETIKKNFIKISEKDKLTYREMCELVGDRFATSSVLRKRQMDKWKQFISW